MNVEIENQDKDRMRKQANRRLLGALLLAPFALVFVFFAMESQPKRPIEPVPISIEVVNEAALSSAVVVAEKDAQIQAAPESLDPAPVALIEPPKVVDAAPKIQERKVSKPIARIVPAEQAKPKPVVKKILKENQSAKTASATSKKPVYRQTKLSNEKPIALQKKPVSSSVVKKTKTPLLEKPVASKKEALEKKSTPVKKPLVIKKIPTKVTSTPVPVKPKPKTPPKPKTTED